MLQPGNVETYQQKFQGQKKEWKARFCCLLTLTISSRTLSLAPRGHGGTMPASLGMQREAVGWQT